MRRTDDDRWSAKREPFVGAVADEDGSDAAAAEIDIPDYVVRDFDGEVADGDGELYVGVREAAEMLGTSQRKVRKLAAHGELETDADSRLSVSVSSVRRLASGRRVR